jgi:hypothetical protein
MAIFHLKSDRASLNILCVRKIAEQRQPGKTWKRALAWMFTTYNYFRVWGTRDGGEAAGVDEVAVCMWGKFSCFPLLCGISIENSFLKQTFSFLPFIYVKLFSYFYLILTRENFFSSHKKFYEITLKSDIFGWSLKGTIKCLNLFYEKWPYCWQHSQVLIQLSRTFETCRLEMKIENTF